MIRRIAYLTPLYFDAGSCLGGGERYPLYLASGVVDGARDDYEIEIISYGVKARREELRPGVVLRVLKSKRPANSLDALSWDMPEAIEGADLVHIHQVYTRSSLAALLAAKQQGKPVCITDHGARCTDLGIEETVIELADRILCYSDFGASVMRSNIPVVVIKGGVDTNLFVPPPTASRREFVLYVGRLLPHKGIDQLIYAMPPDLPLVVCGRPYHDDYFRLLKAQAAGKRVTFVTDADDAKIRELYAHALVNVLPSVYRDCYGNTHRAPELMGLTLLEAMACGTPAIAANVAAMPEFIDDGETGFVYRDLGELTNLLVRLAKTPGLADRIGRHARRTVVREFDRKVVGAKMAAVYESLIDSARKEAA
jgi:glycosyltransferase involved in cell wall biosynthesis